MPTINFGNYEITQDGGTVKFVHTDTGNTIEFDDGDLNAEDGDVGFGGANLTGRISQQSRPDVLAEGMEWEQRFATPQQFWSTTETIGSSPFQNTAGIVSYDDVAIAMSGNAEAFEYTTQGGYQATYTNVAGRSTLPVGIGIGETRLYFTSENPDTGVPEIVGVERDNLSADSPSFTWEIANGNSPAQVVPIHVDESRDNIYTLDATGVFHAVDRSAETVNWSVSIDVTNPVHAEFLPADDMVYVVGQGGTLQPISLTSQSVSSVVTLERQVSGDVNTAAYQDGYWYIAYNGGVAAYSDDAKRIWDEPIGENILDISLFDGTIGAVATDGGVRVLSMRDGSVVSTQSVTGQVGHTTTVGGILIATAIAATDGDPTAWSFGLANTMYESDGSTWVPQRSLGVYAGTRPRPLPDKSVDRAKIQDGEVTRDDLQLGATTSGTAFGNVLPHDSRFSSLTQLSLHPDGGGRYLTPLSNVPSQIAAEGYEAVKDPQGNGIVRVGASFPDSDNAPVWVFDLDTMQWVQDRYPNLNSLADFSSTGVAEFGACEVVADQYIVYAGGYVDGSDSDAIYVLDTAADSPSWSKLSTTLPAPLRERPTSVAYEGEMYIASGYDSNAGSYSTATFKIDPAADTLTTLADFPNADGLQYGGPGAVVDGMFYTNGVPDGADFSNPSWDVYDIEADSWTTAAWPGSVLEGNGTDSEAFDGANLVEYNGYVVYFDGSYVRDIVDVAYYNPDTDSWTGVQKPDFPSDGYYTDNMDDTKRGPVIDGVVYMPGCNAWQQSFMGYKLDPDPFGVE